MRRGGGPTKDALGDGDSFAPRLMRIFERPYAVGMAMTLDTGSSLCVVVYASEGIDMQSDDTE